MSFLFKKKPVIEEIGFKTDQEGILERYFQEEGAWNEHLENTKSFILESAATKKKDTVVILGSGWWLDIPMNEISKMFNKVVLVDIVHPKIIVHKAGKLGNVELVSTDITGGAAEKVVELVNQFKKTKKVIPLDKINIDPRNFGIQQNIKPDFIISANILNQLDINLIDYLRKSNLYSEQELIEFRKNIQANHIKGLAIKKSCLITDYEELIYNAKDELEQTKPLIYISLPTSSSTKHWQWKFDLKGTYNKNKKTMFNVVAIDF